MTAFALRTKPKKAEASAPAKKKKSNWLLRLNAWLHLWPSIISGIIVIIVCLSGTIIVYCDEIMNFTAGPSKYVSLPPDAKPVTADAILNSIKDRDSAFQVSEMVFFQEEQRSVRVRAFHKGTGKLNLIYVNPYTAEILDVDYTIHFFFVMAHIHSHLLAGKIGGWIVLLSTVIFLVSCITGLVLWWPKRWTKKTRQDSFTVKWKAKFKRLNYDLHNVYGFYALLLCFILSLTGVFIFFHSLSEAISKTFGGSADHLETILPKAIEGAPSLDFAQLAFKALKKHPNQPNASIWVPRENKTGAYVFNLGVAGLKSTENLAVMVFDKYTGQELAVEKPYIIHEQVENSIWQLHMGQWWGQFGKFSTFLAGLIATSLPITGFLIWWGRTRKKKKIPKPQT
ncbi:PepSY-associated TM helix domain-containing protein [Sphingobacterium sp. HJSM2_6]|uniref:PepSY-associated TM helix domain-containing protein n=1 Tax=Sphingobacterium sp. HJSM2_6 TaxID=3366264 RepID=UPI003BCBBCD7